MHPHTLPLLARHLLFGLLVLLMAACSPKEPLPAKKEKASPPARLAVAHSPAPVVSSTQLTTDLDSALVLQSNWQFQEALHLLEIAIEREAPQPLSATDTLLAIVYHKAGISCYVLDQYEKAIAYFQHALDIREAVFSQNHPDVIRGYNNIGNVYDLIGEREKALEFLLHSLSLQPEPPIDPYPATIRALGRIYDDMNDAYRAEQYLELALDAYRRFYPDAPGEIAGAYTDLSYFYINKEKYEASLLASQSALQIWLSTAEKQRQDSSGIAKAYTNMSVAFEKMNVLDSAMHFQVLAKQWNERLYPPTAPLLAVNYNNIGYLHYLQKRSTLAQAVLNKAIRINTQNEDYLRLCDNLENLGNVNLQQRDFEQAIHWYHKALRQLIPNLPRDEQLIIPSVNEVQVEPLRVMKNLYLKGKALRAQFEETGEPASLHLARQHFDTLSLLADRLRFSYLADDSKINLVRQTKVFFEEAIKVNLGLYAYDGDQKHAERAFELAEKSKAIVLLEALKETRARQFAGLEEADLKREQLLKQKKAQLELDIYQAEQQSSVDLAQVQEWKRSLISTYEEYEQLVEQLEEKSPDYYRLKYDNRVLSVQEIQEDSELLADDQAMLEFFAGEDAIFVFRISQLDFQVETISLDFSLSATVDSFRQSIHQFLQDPENTLPVYLDQGQSIYQKIWAPIAENLPKKVIIIPDDVLGLLPFEALLTAPATLDQPLNEWPFLLKTHQICYNYSATLLQETLKQPASRQIHDQILAFAPSFERKIQTPPPAAGQNPIADNTRETNARQGLQPLFFNEEEVESIGRIAATKIYTGEKANKQNFRELAPQYRFLHIATHGLADDEEPDYSFVAFSQPADTILLEEVLLVNELYNLQLNADMVVLSACETGVGKIQRGEGIVSLARGFSYAGARSIITTLWNISDQRSNDLMQNFYQQLRDGRAKDDALRQAKMQFVHKNSQLAHPYFWAGFIPLGDMAAVEMDSPKGWGKFALYAGVLVLLMGVYRVRRVRRVGRV